MQYLARSADAPSPPPDEKTQVDAPENTPALVDPPDAPAPDADAAAPVQPPDALRRVAFAMAFVDAVAETLASLGSEEGDMHGFADGQEASDSDDPILSPDALPSPVVAHLQRQRELAQREMGKANGKKPVM